MLFHKSKQDPQGRKQKSNTMIIFLTKSAAHHHLDKQYSLATNLISDAPISDTVTTLFWNVSPKT